MRKPGIIIFFAVVLIVGVFFIVGPNKTKIQSPLAQEKPFDKYTYVNLRKTSIPPGPVVLGESLNQTAEYISQLFYFRVGGKKVSGLINVPEKTGNYPVLVMLRGFVPVEIYAEGIGTQRAGEYFAKNGYITLAPDFFGYGQSDGASQDAIEDRLQTYTTVLSLLSSLVNLNSGLDASYSGKITADVSKVGIWAHSNGGQIAISALEVTGKNYPTVLWAPVSKPFPYSILYFTDDISDHGKALRKIVADFENDYDIEKYSPSNYYSWINASIQIHQGSNDESVPLKWSDNLVEELTKLDKKVEYFTYPGADHNLMPDGWDDAVLKSLSFYKSHL
jgi:uncharacterized protein